MKNIIVFSFLVILLFSACKDDFFNEVVNVEIPEHTPALAVTSNISSADTILWVYVSTSIGILDTASLETIEDAEVEIYKDGSFFMDLEHERDGLYTRSLSQAFGNDESVYELKVSKSGFETVMAEQQMPDEVSISEITFEEDGTINDEGERVDEVVISFQDERGKANFYRVFTEIEITNSNGTFSYEIFLNSNDPSIMKVDNNLYFSDAFFDGENYDLRLWEYNLDNTDDMDEVKIKARLISLTLEKYYWETSLENADNSNGNPFAEPTVIFSNIENGYGIFSFEAIGPEYILEL